MSDDIRSFVNRTRNFKRELSLWNPLFLVFYYLINDIKLFLTKIPRGSVVLDLGCGTKPYVIFLKKSVQYIGVDIDKKNKNVDIYSSVYRVPLKSRYADFVVSFQVMEHLEEPLLMLKEAYRLLKFGGKIFITLPMSEHLHEEPYDFFRYTEYGAVYLLKKAGFKDIKIIRMGTNMASIGRRLSQAIYMIPFLKLFVPIINCFFWKIENRKGNDVANYAFIAIKKG